MLHSPSQPHTGHHLGFPSCFFPLTPHLPEAPKSRCVSEHPLGKNAPDPGTFSAGSPFPATSTDYPSGRKGGETPSPQMTGGPPSGRARRAGTGAGSPGRAQNAFSARPPGHSLSTCLLSGELGPTGGRSKLHPGTRSADAT